MGGGGVCGEVIQWRADFVLSRLLFQLWLARWAVLVLVLLVGLVLVVTGVLRLGCVRVFAALVLLLGVG